MKNTILLFALCILICQSASLQAQLDRAMKSTNIGFNRTDIAMVKYVPDWSDWITDEANMPGLKVRERHYTPLNGSTQILELEVQSNKRAEGSFTVSTCSENLTMNGWQTLSLAPNTPQKIKFETTDPCNNGWWWQVQGYRVLTAWGNWSDIDNHGLQGRTRYNFTAQGEKFLQLEILSTKTATLEIAVKVCQTDEFGKNGWRKIQLQKDEAKTFNFYMHDTCEDGWWWQYRNYKNSSPGFGDDLELNPVGE